MKQHNYPKYAISPWRIGATIIRVHITQEHPIQFLITAYKPWGDRSGPGPDNAQWPADGWGELERIITEQRLLDKPLYEDMYSYWLESYYEWFNRDIRAFEDRYPDLVADLAFEAEMEVKDDLNRPFGS